MTGKQKAKISVDVLMTVLLLFLMNYQFWGERLHEWVGIGIFVLFIAHHLLNLAWYKSLCKGQYTAGRVFRLVLNTPVLLAMLLLMVSSVCISRYVFAFLPIRSGMGVARRLHLLGSYWGFLLMSLHLGMHWNMILGMVGKNRLWMKSKTGKIILFSVGVIIAAYGVVFFLRHDYVSYLFLQNEFILLDGTETPLLYSLKSISLMGLFAFASYWLTVVLGKINTKMRKMRGK